MGCKAYMRILSRNRSKLDKQSKPFMFIGYEDTQGAWKLFDPKTKKVFVSRDVVFVEDETINSSNDTTQNPTTVDIWMRCACPV